MNKRQLKAWLKALPAATTHGADWTFEQSEAVYEQRAQDRDRFEHLLKDLYAIDAELAGVSKMCGDDNMREGVPDLTERCVGYWAERYRFLAGAAGILWAEADRSVNKELGYKIF